MQTINLANVSLRDLKGMKKYHRKLRAHPLHADAFRNLRRIVKMKNRKTHIG